VLARDAAGQNLPLGCLYGVIQPSRSAQEPPTFESIYRRHELDVVRYLALLLRDLDEAEDVAADVFERAFRAWRDGRGPAGAALPWLLTIGRRLAFNRLRRRRLLSWLPLPDLTRWSPQPGSRDADRAEFWLWLDALAAALPERQREVVYLRYRRQLSDEEIGEVMGLTASGVRSLAARAVAGLRAHPELWR
jgi:RNA polymerase sigma factor (sigma-70 family)